MTARIELIRLIVRHADNKAPPPFTAEELIILSLVMEVTEMTAKEVFEWILEHFAYYRNLAHEALWRQPYYTNGTCDIRGLPHGEMDADQRKISSSISTFRRALDKAFWRYEMPLRTREGSDRVMYYRIPQVTGTKMLEKYTATSERKSFPFFRLPAELRNAIYELVFQYPRSGIGIMKATPRRDTYGARPALEFAVLSRGDDRDFNFHTWTRRSVPRHDYQFQSADQLLRTRSTRAILAPLAANRQFYNEAMPLFYHLNRFYFRSLREMAHSLEKLAVNRRKHIRHICFEYHHNSYDDYRCYADDAFNGLAELKGLVRLDIFIDENTVSNSRGHFDGPGLEAWRKVEGLQEVVFHDDSRTVEGGSLDAFKDKMKKHMLRPRRETVEPKKRKRGGPQSFAAEDSDEEGRKSTRS